MADEQKVAEESFSVVTMTVTDKDGSVTAAGTSVVDADDPYCFYAIEAPNNKD